MAFAPLVVAAISAAGAIYSGYQQKAQADAMADNASANAANLRRQSNANEESQRRENKLRMGAVRASAAESGFDPNAGSLASLQIKNAQELELDVLTQRYSDELSSLSLQNESATLRSQGKAARTSGFLSAAGTLAQGAMGGYGQANRQMPFAGYGDKY